MPSAARIALDVLRGPTRRVRYGRHRCQRADLHLPGGAGPHPVVVVIHGGYWRAKHTKLVMRPLSADLARRGWAAWNIEYRKLGRGQGGGWPATFDDVAVAIDHLAKLDAALDLDRVWAVGHSAGGQLALWAGGRPRLGDRLPGARPQVSLRGLVAQGALSDLTSSSRQAGSVVLELLGGTAEERPARYDATDPMRQIPLGIPVLLVHGTADETVPTRRSRDYDAAARAAGADVEFVEVPGGGHRAHIDPRSSEWEVAAAWLQRRGRQGAG